MFLEVRNSNQQRLSFSSSLSSPSLSPGRDNCWLWVQRFAIRGVRESHPPLSFLGLVSPAQSIPAVSKFHFSPHAPVSSYLDMMTGSWLLSPSSNQTSVLHHFFLPVPPLCLPGKLNNNQFPGNNLDSPPKHRQGALLCIELSLWALTLILPRFCGQFLDLSHNPCSLLCAQSNFSGCTLSATFSPSFFSASSAWIICLPLHPLRCPNSETSKSLVLH